MNKIVECIICSILLVVFCNNLCADVTDLNQVKQSLSVKNDVWFDVNDEDTVVKMYFFHSNTCPHCQKAKPFIAELDAKYKWLKVFSYELSGNRENAQKFSELSKLVGKNISSVPAFSFCNRMEVGYNSDITTGKHLQDLLQACYEDIRDNESSVEKIDTESPSSESFAIPIIGGFVVGDYALPVITVIIAGLDAFNPCAFFVLLFLLSLMVHAKSRSRMLLIGGVFVFFSGLIYFMFMSAWLNVFFIFGEIQLVTMVAGMVAIIFSLVNIKDYFWFKKGISLSISEKAKPGLYQRTRKLLSATNIGAVLFGTVLLAIAANSYELLCTAGFPMVYTRILTLSKLTNTAYYLYLVLYNIVYVIPLLIIVLVFVYRFNSRKLSEAEGRILKLLSGYMMVLLGSLLVLSPALLNNIKVALGIIILAILATFATVKIGKYIKNNH